MVPTGSRSAGAGPDVAGPAVPAELATARPAGLGAAPVAAQPAVSAPPASAATAAAPAATRRPRRAPGILRSRAGRSGELPGARPFTPAGYPAVRLSESPVP